MTWGFMVLGSRRGTRQERVLTVLTGIFLYSLSGALLSPSLVAGLSCSDARNDCYVLLHIRPEPTRPRRGIMNLTDTTLGWFQDHPFSENHTRETCREAPGLYGGSLFYRSE